MEAAMSKRQTLPEAMQELKDTARPIFEPPLLRMVQWIDRQIQRSLRLHRWLSK